MSMEKKNRIYIELVDIESRNLRFNGSPVCSTLIFNPNLNQKSQKLTGYTRIKNLLQEPNQFGTMNLGHTNNFRDLLGYELVEKQFKNIKRTSLYPRQGHFQHRRQSKGNMKQRNSIERINFTIFGVFHAQKNSVHGFVWVFSGMQENFGVGPQRQSNFHFSDGNLMTSKSLSQLTNCSSATVRHDDSGVRGAQ